MSHYRHLTTNERESILKDIAAGLSLRQIAARLGRAPSTITREVGRNRGRARYSLIAAEARYRKKREACRRPFVLADPALREQVRRLICEEHWSPQEIAERMRLNGVARWVSCSAIYNAINHQLFEARKLYHGERGFKRYLRHKGKRRKGKDCKETRGKLTPPLPWENRPAAAGDRREEGWLEADTIHGGRGGLVTIVDRKTRFLYCKRVADRNSDTIAEAIIALLCDVPLWMRRGITPDQGKEFFAHQRVSAALDDLPFYFAPPRKPWLRGTNENTNGLIREYFPKGTNVTEISDDFVQAFTHKLNARPRKCLGWLSPAEVVEAARVLHLDE